jgi:hypothetical protein
MRTATAPQTSSPPSEPRAAQIPLQDFIIPSFPPEAQALEALTLTCDVPLSDYPALITQAASPPDFNLSTLPPTIHSLTLELFSFGYPPAFLPLLAKRLPALRSLTIYAQLFGGTTEASRHEALEFFRGVRGLRELALIDAFAESGFWRAVAEILQDGDGIRFLEASFSFRGGEQRLKGVQGDELVELVGVGCVGVVLNLSAPSKEEDSEEDASEAQDVPEGILPYEDGSALVERLTGTQRPANLLLLNSSLFKLSIAQLTTIVQTHKGLKVLTATVEMVVGDLDILADGLKDCPDLERLEIIVWPSEELVRMAQDGRDVGPTAEEVARLGERCAKLTSVVASILRTKEVEWVKVDGEWKVRAS